VLNYAPAVAEAFYQKLPLIVITADRPAAWIGQMDGQTLPQPDVFKSLVRTSVQLPEIISAQDEWYANRLINEALLAATHRSFAPVHINIPLSEPLCDYGAEHLPQARKITRQPRTTSRDDFAPYAKRFQSFQRPMIIAGQSVDAGVGQELDKLIEVSDCVVLTEHLSNISSQHCIRNFDAMLCAIPVEEAPRYAPDLLITMGGHIVSKRIKKFLRTHPPLEHWHVSTDGEIVDTYQCLTDAIEAEAAGFIRCLAEYPGSEPRKPFSTIWRSFSDKLPEPEAEYSDLMAVGLLMKALPQDANLQLANSSSVRLAQLFSLTGNHRVYSNRGTSGIDGCLSTAAGQAAVSRHLTFLIIGDLSFFYDMNGLWNNHLSKNLRILLNNNSGGGIFHTLPGIEYSKAMDAPHSQSARAWAEDRGLAYLSASNAQELKSQIPVFTAKDSNKPMLLEVFIPRQLVISKPLGR
jgi:2-succinyl-5-enolpyruvyl-6-hydroxy-3-cyclohexene-1-carboxylate synthase